MNKSEKKCRSLREIETQVEAEMREFGRRRMEEELQKEADQHGQVFPPERSTSPSRAKKDDAPAHGRRSD
jgi:hypothetical protein